MLNGVLHYSLIRSHLKYYSILSDIFTAVDYLYLEERRRLKIMLQLKIGHMILCCYTISGRTRYKFQKESVIVLSLFFIILSKNTQ